MDNIVTLEVICLFLLLCIFSAIIFIDNYLILTIYALSVSSLGARVRQEIILLLFKRGKQFLTTIQEFSRLDPGRNV